MQLVQVDFLERVLGNSTQKLHAIPEAQNDMILAVICEELGVFGAIIILCLFAFMLYRLLFIARNAPDSVWCVDRNRYFCTYCTAGYFEYCGCNRIDAYYRSYASIYKLWRYGNCDLAGRDGNCAWNIFEDPVEINSPSFQLD